MMGGECPTKQPDRLLTVQEVAEWLRVPRSWVEKHSSGKRRPVLPCIRLSPHYLRFRESEIAKFIEECNRNAQ